MKSNEMPPMSDEQRIIYEHIKNGDNVIGNACAGSGKSTTILSIAKELKEKKIVQLTYNSMLCSDVKEKIEQYELNNIDVYTYHSMVVKYYDSKGYTDTIIRRIVYNNTLPKKPIEKFDILVIDESQDMTKLYFKLVLKICRDMNYPIQILILGDEMQGLYEFKGADIRFLTKSCEIWKQYEGLKTKKFHECSLKMSYRITQQMADFVNKVMLGEERLLACKEGEPVVYIRQPTHFAEKYIIYKINLLIDTHKATPSDFFILGASMKEKNGEIRKIENALVENNIPCYVPLTEDEKMDERVIEGKIVFSTFHSVKGRQRKYVFVIGFNQSYFEFYAKNLPIEECPNALYVACTRATHGLFIVEGNNNMYDRPPKFIKMKHHEMKNQSFVDFRGLQQSIFEEKKENKKNVIHTKNTTPADLTRFLPENVLDEINPLLEKIFIPLHEKTLKEIDIPNIIETKNGFYEDVSNINSIALPLLYYDDRTKTNENYMFLKNSIEEQMNEIKHNHHRFLKKMLETTEKKENEITIMDYLKMSNLYYAVKEKIYFKLKQIQNDEYTWFSQEMLNECFVCADEILGDDLKLSGEKKRVEHNIIIKTDDEMHKKIDEYLKDYFSNVLFRFTANVNLMTENTIWEIKCASVVTHEHLLQMAIKCWLWRMTKEDMENLINVLEFKIFNMKTGEHYLLRATTEELNKIMLLILNGKYTDIVYQKDEEFVEECVKNIFVKNTMMNDNENRMNDS